MCVQSDWVFTCGHRAFAKFDNCPKFGRGCFGQNGTHQDVYVQDICNDCKLRPLDPNPQAVSDDPYRKKRALR
ncbi:hypothetical protein QBC41DRAFT_122456 [Cercophora samala]|uniref:Uncharacterized protein n=1 Tax=Cercophora samala TaxID=330535 RepID=A0AA39ZD05_9PEZI|nr:hypothetical protein QBC41DRAFT_122456 [Cercophora samala]